MPHRIAFLLFASALLSVPSDAQVSDSCQETIIAPAVDKIVQALEAASALTDAEAKGRAKSDAKQGFRNLLGDGTLFGGCLGGLDEQRFAGILEVRRFDKQVGATNGAAGSTNLVPSGSVPALLGLAVEYGGLTEAFSGTTVTFRTTPAKLIGAMANVYGPNAKPPTEKALLALERLSLSVSFDTSRTSSASTDGGSTLLANYQQLSQMTVRYIIRNDRDPLAASNWRDIIKLSQSRPSQNVANAGRDLHDPLSKMPAYDEALDKAMKAFDANAEPPSKEALTKVLVTYVQDMQLLTVLVPDWQQRVRSYIDARLKLDGEHRDLYRRISRKPTLSVEYDLNRPPTVSAEAVGTSAPAVDSPDLSTVSLVYVASLYESQYTLTANANFFNDTRPGMSGNFRDFQLAAKWDIPIGHVPSFIAKGTLTFSGLFEHLHQRPLGIDLSINDVTVNQPGNMGIFQAKYTIPLGDTGIQMPISFTASNRTELIKEKDLRGNIGITFDLDKLLAKK